ncbi:MAG: L,D-transpeptidase [Firmicutes bacterium]|nr:L,D-transpeptidase [Bacillota bacterium]
MGIKTVFVGLIVLAAATTYVVRDTSVLHSGQQAVESATGNISAQVAALAGHKTVSVSTALKEVVANPKAGIGRATGLEPAALRVTTDNAPPPTPTVIDGVHMRYDPLKPSDGPYPDIAKDKHVWFDISISQQLAYLFNGDHLLYTFITSSGIDTNPDNSTPLGVYHIQGVRGNWFYSQQYAMGAKYWVSWLGNGIFLFHSVPMNQDQQIIPSIAAKLGHPASHGCFHLTVPDAKWVEEHIPFGTDVIVEQAPVKLLGKTLYDPTGDQQAAEVGATLANTPSSYSSS